MPRIPAVDLNCVFYLYPDEAAAKSGLRLGGSGFWVAIQSEKIPDFVWVYAVSNKHVVHQGGASVIRANARGGEGVTIIPTEPTDWIEHPAGHDIAVAPMNVSLLWPQVELIAVAPRNFVTEAHVEDQRIGVGDEIYLIGRFINHEGRARNTPSARFGNISMMPTEPIYIDAKSPAQESFAVELRSMCGYSGSPVFAQGSGWKKMPDGQQKLHWDVDLLLGVHWGHIVEPWTVEKRIVKTRRTALGPDEREIDLVGANTGMNGVVPAWRLMELLDLPVFKNGRDNQEAYEVEKRKHESPSASLDVASVTSEEVALPATHANPNHREDFNRLLGAAVGPKPSDSGTK